ncbi:MAG TPA: thioesterase family protein [Bacteroidia bacterium]|nr:thioesterase family protein [Bacteroidia bacterium]
MSKKDFSHISIKDYKHSTPIQIRFVDIDRVGHVNNATILSYFETARVVFLDEIIGRENDWYERGLILAHTEIDYLLPVYLEDKIKSYTRVTRVGTKSFEMENVLVKVKDGKEIMTAFATFVIVCMDYKTNQTVEIPSSWKEKLMKN